MEDEQDGFAVQEGQYNTAAKLAPNMAQLSSSQHALHDLDSSIQVGPA